MAKNPCISFLSLLLSTFTNYEDCSGCSIENEKRPLHMHGESAE
jgi:hypothetical protein